MRVDAAALQEFYASPLGEAAQRMIARRLAAAWPDLAGRDVLGLGFAGAYLDPYRTAARRALVLAPAGQGAVVWPGEGHGAAVLGDEGRLPFMDAIFDRVLLVHALEEADAPHAFLREVWRVMAPEGRLVLVVANRRGLWAIADSTPFGHGRPYSRSQLATLLGDCMFEPAASARALYAPPWGFGPLLRLADGLERVGERLWPAFGGVILMEAVKRIEARPMSGGRVVRVAAPVRAGQSRTANSRRNIKRLPQRADCAFMKPTHMSE